MAAAVAEVFLGGFFKKKKSSNNLKLDRKHDRHHCTEQRRNEYGPIILNREYFLKNSNVQVFLLLV